MANLKPGYSDPFAVGGPVEPEPAKAEHEPLTGVNTAPTLEVVRPARPKRAQARPEPEPAADPERPAEHVRITAEAGDWLREIRFRHRVPAAAMIRALVELAQDDPKLATAAIKRVRQTAARGTPNLG